MLYVYRGDLIWTKRSVDIVAVLANKAVTRVSMHALPSDSVNRINFSFDATRVNELFCHSVATTARPFFSMETSSMPEASENTDVLTKCFGFRLRVRVGDSEIIARDHFHFTVPSRRHSDTSCF